MRKLFILRGVMASGKSTFIKENNLDDFTISTDKIRLLLNAPELTLNYGEAIPQFNNKTVWKLVFYFLEERMKKGELTIIDATHIYADNFKTYKKLAEKYRYRLFVIDFTGIPLEVLLERNKNREAKRIVPEKDVIRAYEYSKKEEIPKVFKVIKPDEFKKVISNHVKDVNDYEKIHIFGDIHGCYKALSKYFDENPINDNELYIFTGDYFDRGLENINMFNFVKDNCSKENFTFLIGNHEDKLYKYASDDKFSLDYSFKKTIEEFEGKVKKSEIRGLIKGLSQIMHITYNEKEYLINHGGISYFPEKPLECFSTNTFIYGSGDYKENIDEIYNEYMKNSEYKVYQIHGHRNYQNIDINKYEYSFNLDGDVEYGKNLRIITIDKNGLDFKYIKNDNYDKDLKEKEKVFELVKDLRKSKYIFEKELTTSLSSFNFSKDAFYKKAWSALTTKARGLFIDTKNFLVVARSYDKFFNLNEREETKYESVIDFKYPINFYLKYNGFLGILSIYEGEFLFATKSQIKSIHSDYFKSIFYEIYDENQINEIKKRLTKNNSSMVFEVIDVVNDKHIIEYNKNKLVLLDEIYNKIEFEKTSYEDLKKFADKNKIEVKKLVYTANDKDAFTKIYNIIDDENYTLDNNFVEGFVLESDSGMVKYKTHYYNTWKNLRNLMERAIKSNDYKIKTTKFLEKEFLLHLEKKYKDKEINLETINVIDERNDFDNK